MRLEALEDRRVLSTFTVVNLLDNGAGSLRAAVAAANANPGADTINFAVTGAIALSSGQLDVTDDLTINGPGAGALTVSGEFASRIAHSWYNVLSCMNCNPVSANISSRETT